jgi:hypothetical protein
MVTCGASLNHFAEVAKTQSAAWQMLTDILDAKRPGR